MTRKQTLSRLSCAILFFVVYVISVVYNATNCPTSIKVNAGVGDQAARLDYEALIGREQTDPYLVTMVREQLLLAPSSEPYNLHSPDTFHHSQFGQDKFANENFLKNMRGGFFVEVGAFNGEWLSNTLFFERFRGWSGLLIEADPLNFMKLLTVHRKAYAVNVGVAFNTTADIAYFRQASELGHVTNKKEKSIPVKIVPFLTLLLALNVFQIDYFSLDVEAAEMEVLRAMPWDKVKVRLMCVEVNHVKEGVQGVTQFMEERGYTFLGLRKIDAWFGRRELLQETMDVDAYLTKANIELQRREVLSGKITQFSTKD